MSKIFDNPIPLNWTETKSKIVRTFQALVCLSTLHYWSKWTTPNEVKITNARGGWTDTEFYQARVCHRCRCAQVRGWSLNATLKKKRA